MTAKEEEAIISRKTEDLHRMAIVIAKELLTRDRREKGKWEFGIFISEGKIKVAFINESNKQELMDLEYEFQVKEEFNKHIKRR